MACEIVQLTEDFLLIHNKDPTKANVSAWEQMKAREEEQRKDKIERDQRLFHWSDKESPSYLQKQAYFDNSEHKVEIQKEMKRQIEALDNADEGRRKNKSAVIKSSITKSRDNSSSGDLFSDDEEDIDFDDDADQRLNSSSRYKSDFVELKFLGRGGGGEVVKVVNKLDRRRCKYSSLLVLQNCVNFVHFPSNEICFRRNQKGLSRIGKG
jgi:translation initiation factor 2-alpha kinase 4